MGPLIHGVPRYTSCSAWYIYLRLTDCLTSVSQQYFNYPILLIIFRRSALLTTPLCSSVQTLVCRQCAFRRWTDAPGNVSSTPTTRLPPWWKSLSWREVLTASPPAPRQTWNTWSIKFPSRLTDVLESYLLWWLSSGRFWKGVMGEKKVLKNL